MNDERKPRVRVSSDRRGQVVLHLGEGRLSGRVTLRKRRVEVRHLSVRSLHEDVADLPRERHLLADRQLGIEHRGGAGQRGAVGR